MSNPALLSPYTDARVGRTHLRARRCQFRPGAVAWAADTPDLGDSPWDVRAGMIVTIRYGDTPDDAIAALKGT